MLANSVKEEKKDGIVNSQKQGPGRSFLAKNVCVRMTECIYLKKAWQGSLN